ncbi:hypothetical protein [Acidovorax sp. SUPP3334]|uniref:hypothetical protein n=1 Tax=Acidovorax sp. SUPP3334 TaxID=2920881 RepID=UPI0023DE5269|nr:hypothetical protein [Acidovorax sp. SUPP3334]GKT21625.1 hypothetical protein AVHM3334_05425 [Acidovorax sp. SUPP3334]
MSSPPPKAPPRFVPTLTDVVQLADGVPGVGQPGVPVKGAVSPSVPHAPAVSPVPAPVPRPSVPRPSVAVPAVARTLPNPAPHPLPPVRPTLPSTPTPSAAPAPAVFARPAPGLKDIEEVVIHRVMQRVDVVLDQRLREAIATVVLEQTRSIVPRLREEVESVVRHAVYEAVAEELASHPGTAPG